MPQPNITVESGRLITPLSTVDIYSKKAQGELNILLGSVSNAPVVAGNEDLYAESDAYGHVRMHVPVRGLNLLNLIVGGQSSGKSVLLMNAARSLPDFAKMIINDPKGEWIESFFEPGRDLIINHFDTRGVVWHIIGEALTNRLKIEKYLYNFLKPSLRGDKEGLQWIARAASFTSGILINIADRLESGEAELADVPGLLELLYAQGRAQYSGDEMMMSVLNTAQPGIAVIHQMYQIAITENRELLTVDAMLQKRRIFIVMEESLGDYLKMVNNALLAAMINAAMPPGGATDDFDLQRAIFFFIDEYLTFDIDPDTELSFMTKGRGYNLCVFLGIQSIPVDKNKLLEKTHSRYLSVVFGSNTDDTLNVCEGWSGKISYSKRQLNRSAGGGGGLSSAVSSVVMGPSVSESWQKCGPVPVVSSTILKNLPPNVGYLEIVDARGAKLTGELIQTFIKPVYFRRPKKNPPFLMSEQAKKLKMFTA